MTHNINKTKNKYYVMTSTDAERGKSQHSFVIKTLNKVEIEGMFLNIKKATYDKPTVNPIRHGEKLEAIPLTSGTK